MRNATKYAMLLTTTLAILTLGMAPASAATASKEYADLPAWVEEDSEPCPDEVCTACLLGWMAACAGAPEVFICKEDPESGLCLCCGKCKDLSLLGPTCTTDGDEELA